MTYMLLLNCALKLVEEIILVLCIVCFVLFYVLFVCKCVLPPGDNPIAVNKYIISGGPKMRKSGKRCCRTFRRSSSS